MQRTRIEVWDSDLNDVEGTVSIDSETIFVYRGSSSLPIEVYVQPGCDTELFVDIGVNTRADNAVDVNVNPEERVTVQPNQLQFVPWKYLDEFVVSIGSDWNVDLPNYLWIEYSLSGQDAAAFLTNKIRTGVNVLWDETALEQTVTSYEFRVVNENVERNEIKNLRLSTDGSGVIEWVALPYLRQIPSSQEITDYNDGTYSYVDRADNNTRRLQSGDNSDTNNQWEADTNAKHGNFLQSGYSAGQVYAHGAGTHFFDVDGLWAGECFKAYATFTRLNGVRTGVFYHDSGIDTCTQAQAPDEPMSFVISGETMPQGNVLQEII